MRVFRGAHAQNGSLCITHAVMESRTSENIVVGSTKFVLVFIASSPLSWLCEVMHTTDSVAYRRTWKYIIIGIRFIPLCVLKVCQGSAQKELPNSSVPFEMSSGASILCWESLCFKWFVFVVALSKALHMSRWGFVLWLIPRGLTVTRHRKQHGGKRVCLSFYYYLFSSCQVHIYWDLLEESPLVQNSILVVC